MKTALISYDDYDYHYDCDCHNNRSCHCGLATCHTDLQLLIIVYNIAWISHNTSQCKKWNADSFVKPFDSTNCGSDQGKRDQYSIGKAVKAAKKKYNNKYKKELYTLQVVTRKEGVIIPLVATQVIPTVNRIVDAMMTKLRLN